MALGNAVIIKPKVEAPDFKPFGDRLLCKFEKPDTTIELLDDTRFGNFARVVARGPGRTKPDGTLHPVAIELGAKVLLPNRPCDAVTLNGETWIIVHESELLGQVGEGVKTL